MAEDDAPVGAPADDEITDEDIEQVDEAGEQLEEAEQNAPPVIRKFAIGYIATLVLIIIVGAVAMYQYGVVTPDISPTASPDFTKPIEEFVLWFSRLFLVFTAGMMAVIAWPYLSGFLSAAVRLLDAFTIPDDWR